MKYSGLMALFAICLVCGCKYQGMIVDVDDVEMVELDQIHSDIKIVPIKCDYPLDYIHRTIVYDDYIFLLGLSRKMIYCVQGDSVISVLDAKGRGYGEYSFINDFSYSEKEKVLYVAGDGKYLKYSIPSMTFLGSWESNITTGGILALNQNELFVNCSYIQSDRDVYSGICILSSNNGEVLRKCYDLEYINKQFSLERDYTKQLDYIVFSVNSLSKNRIVRYDIKDGTTQELFSFYYNSKWRVPRHTEKLASKDPLMFAYEDYNRKLHCDGCHYPSIINSRLSFWSFPRENDKVRSVVTIVKDGIPIRRSFKVSGTDYIPGPSCIHDGYCVDLIASKNEVAVTDSDNLSPLGKELNRIMNSQPFDNPILLYFTFDKGL